MNSHSVLVPELKSELEDEVESSSLSSEEVVSSSESTSVEVSDLRRGLRRAEDVAGIRATFATSWSDSDSSSSSSWPSAR